MRTVAVFALCAVLASQALAAESGQPGPSFDCARAATPTEHLICSDSRLSALDASLADAFRMLRETQDETTRADSLAQQRIWLQSRIAQCGIAARGDIDPAKATAQTACLQTVYQDRIKALQPAPASIKPAAPSASQNTAAGSGTALQKTIFPASGTNETLLDISGFGRYSVTAKSDQGTAIQLVDRMAGPSQVQGSAGHADGRIDAFLDHGQYKVKLISDPHGAGDAELSLRPSIELNPDPQQLVELKPVDTELGDHQQRSYWLNIASGGTVTIEASGRYLDDLRLWRDGKWLVDATPGTVTVDPASGQPLTVKQLAVSLEPGLYRLTAYGGEGQKWATGSAAKPLHVRFGLPKLADAGRSWQVASPTGIDRFLVPASASYFRLDIDKPEHAAISVVPYFVDTPFVGGENRAAIEKTSRDPFAEVTTDGSDEAGKLLLVTVERQPGRGYRLTWFDHRNPQPLVTIGSPAGAWIAMLQGGNDQDEIDPTIVVADENDVFKGVVHERVIASTAIKVDKAIGWQRRFNLLDQTALFLDVAEPVDLSVEGDGVEAQYRVQPFAADPAHPRGYQPSGYGWQLDPGFYRIDILPKENGKGILTLSLHAQGTPKPVKDSPRQAAAMLPLSFERRGNYTVYLNSFERGRAGMRLYNAPVDLGAGIEFEMAGGQTISLPVSANEAGRISATAEDGTGIPLVLDGKAGDLSPTAAAGKHTLSLTMPGEMPRYVAIAFTPARLQGDAALPPLDPKLLDGLPDFPAITQGKPQFLTLDKDQHASFVVPVTKPALYRLESTGIIETEGTLRTRVVPQLDQETTNGTGRNFLIQRYLGQGDYQLTVAAPGQSHGPIGLTLTSTRVRDEGTLQPELWARTTLPSGQAGSYGFHIAQPGKYSLKTMGLGRDFAMRLEDGGGWPILPPGGPADITQAFEAGDYRMILLPGAIENRAVTLLHRIEPSVEHSGHGPFPVIFGEDLMNRWLEPKQGEERTPDRWQFTLPAPAHVTVAIDSGMQATLGGGTGSDTRVFTPGIATPGKDWKGLLQAGRYEITVTSVAANSRVDYTLKVSSDELLAGQTRSITAPAEVPVSIGDGAPVEINSYGASDVRARLYDDKGTLVAANDDRDNDWNFSIATPLTPGSYKLQVDPVSADSAATEVCIEQPAETTDAMAALDKAATISDPLVHVVPLPADLKANSLVIVDVQSAAPVGVEIEQDHEGGSWTSIGSQQGINPFIGVPVGDKPIPLRLRVWSRDHTATSITYTVADTDPKTVEENDIGKTLSLSPMGDLGIVHVALRDPGVLFADGSKTLQWSTALNKATGPIADGQITAPDKDVWLVDRAGSSITSARPDPNFNKPLNLTVPPDKNGIFLPVQGPKAGTAVLWRLTSQGPVQPAVITVPGNWTTTGFGGDSSARSSVTVALPGTNQLHIRQFEAAGQVSSMPVTLDRSVFVLPEPIPLATENTDGLFARNTAASFTLPYGHKMLTLDLPEGTGVMLSDHITGTATANDFVWASKARILEIPVSTTDATLTLFYTGEGQASYSLSLRPIEGTSVFQRHSTSGTYVTVFPAGAVHTFSAVGAIDAMTVIGDSGLVRGRSVTTNNQFLQRALVDYSPGLMAVLPQIPLEAGPDPSVIDVRSDSPRSMAVQPVRISAGPARLVRVTANVPAVFYQGAGSFDNIHPQMLEADTDYFLLMPEAKSRDLMAFAEPKDEQNATARDGTMTLSVLTTTPITEGLGPKRRIAPGEARAFSFTLAEARTVGLGVRASADVANCHVIGPDGVQRGESGKLLMPSLPAGTSVLVVDVPKNAQPVEVEPALVGSVSPGKGPPDDVKGQYLALVNRKTDK